MTSALAETTNRARPRDDERSGWLDGIRGLAAVLVLVAHASRLSVPESRRAAWTPLEALLGQAGVVLFFVLSGYLIGRMWVSDRPTPSLRSYAVRRALRIWPAYALAYLATVLLLSPDDVRSTAQWVLHLLLLHSWWPGEYVAVFPIGWTLGVEAMFYVVAPWLPRSARALGLLWLASAALGLVGGVLAPAASDPSGWVGPLRYSLPPLLCLFCPGILVAMRPAWLDGLRQRELLSLSIAAPALVLAVFLSRQEPVWLRDLHYQALAVAFGIALLHAVDRPPGAPWLLRPMASLGVVSYGIYLWHNTLMNVLIHSGVRAPGGDWAAAAALLMVATLPVAALSWVVVERPALSLARRLTAGSPPLSPAAQPTGSETR
ncbi:MAG: acyltransferase [Mycobacteriales bacterium]|nr:acyltransferase [Mycobacteriales bacterium]